jgi:MYXO-CTERM domain-containing protein
MTSSLRLLSVPVLALTLLTGCNEPELRFEDDIDLEFDLLDIFIPDVDYGEGLHNPYLAGSEFAIYIWDDNDITSFKGWEVRSSDPTVLEILRTERKEFDWDGIEEHYPDHPFHHDDDDEDYVLIVYVRAGQPGTAELSAYDRTDDLHGTATIEVAVPNEIQLRPAGPVFLQRDDIVAQLDADPMLIGGGTATFLVDWLRDGVPLAGDGQVSATSSNDLIYDVWGRETYYDEKRDWLTISADTVEPGTTEVASVDVYVNGNVAETIDFTVVGDEAIDALQLQAREESEVFVAFEGQWIPVLASALDANGETIHGVAFDWDLDGVDEPGEGDLFKYRFDSDVTSILGAEYAGMRVETTIRGDEGFVDTSNDVPGSCFCSADVEQPGGSVGFGLLSLAAIGLVRRRRAR